MHLLKGPFYGDSLDTSNKKDKIKERTSGIQTPNLMVMTYRGLCSTSGLQPCIWYEQGLLGAGQHYQCSPSNYSDLRSFHRSCFNAAATATATAAATADSSFFLPKTRELKLPHSSAGVKNLVPNKCGLRQ